MVLIELLPVFNTHFLMKVLEHSVTLFESSKHIQVSLSRLNILYHLLKLEHGTLTLGSLLLCELLLFKMDDSTLLLASLEQLFDLVSRLLVLIGNLLLVSA